MQFKVGLGYDVHKLVTGRDLIIGGVKIEFDKGLLGHSDADVLTHAIMDSILGALGKGDIGKHFPDTDDSFKNISSISLLKKVLEILKKEKYRIGNIDSVVVAQKPKLLPYMDLMKKAISSALEIDEDLVNIKATTEEGLGFTGVGEGISAKSICLIYKD